jgi:hypothetical protein
MGKNGRQRVLRCAQNDRQKGKGNGRSRSLRDDSQKSKGNGKGRSLRDDSQKSKGNGNGKDEYRGLSATHHDEAMMLRSR